jgi:hypothetical protein
MSPKDSCVEDLVPNATMFRHRASGRLDHRALTLWMNEWIHNWRVYWKVMESVESGAWLEKWVTRSVPLKGLSYHPSFVSGFCFLAVIGEQICSTIPSLLKCSASPQAQKQQCWLWTEDHGPRWIFPQAFATVMESWPTAGIHIVPCSILENGGIGPNPF